MNRGTAPHSGAGIFEILVREHAGMLTAHLRMLLPARGDLVDDLFQETMLVAWRRLDEYDRSRPFGPWLRGIASRLALAHHRQSASTGRSAARARAIDPALLEAIEAQYDQVSVSSSESFRELIDQLVQCVRNLPDKMRETIELIYGRDLRVREASRSVDSNEETVKKRLQRARALLSECLRAHQAPPSTTSS